MKEKLRYLVYFGIIISIEMCIRDSYDVIFGRVHDADHGRSIFYNEDVYQTIIAFLDKHQ